MKYKVVEKMHGQFVGEPDEKTVFEGSLDQLNIEFPPSKIFGADPLSHKQIEDGYVRWDYTFYKSADGLKWEECDDPRSRVNPTQTDLEREIDAENRRLFPGDYEDYDDYDQHDEDWQY